MSHGDLCPDVTKQMKPKDYAEYVTRMMSQHGDEAKFTGDASHFGLISKGVLSSAVSAVMYRIVGKGQRSGGPMDGRCARVITRAHLHSIA